MYDVLCYSALWANIWTCVFVHYIKQNFVYIIELLCNHFCSKQNQRKNMLLYVSSSAILGVRWFEDTLRPDCNGGHAWIRIF